MKIMNGIKIQQIEFNIGLVNNPYNEEEIKLIIKREGFNIFDTTYSFIANGEYLGDAEPTFVTTVSSTKSEEDIVQHVEGLCKLMGQQCIAILLNNSKGHLVYHPHYTAKKFKFDKQYFIDGYGKTFSKNFK